MVAKKKDKLQEQAEQILKYAIEMGTEDNYFFVTTFQRYQDLQKHYYELEENIQEKGVVVTKEYVRDRKNDYVNPALSAQVSLTHAMKEIITTLRQIINDFKKEPKKETSKFLDFINGNEEE